MLPQNRLSSPACLRFFVAWLAAFACAGSLAGAAPANRPTEPRVEFGIQNSGGADGLSAAQLDRLAGRLRQASGYLELGFDRRGCLRLGERTSGGSAAVRALLKAAVEGRQRFELESRPHSDQVSFGLIVSGIGPDGAPSLRQHKILLDFEDFNALQGEPQALAAFDISFVFLHELAHGVWRLTDDLHGLGECEEYINRIRRELGLPERVRYYYLVRRVSDRASSQSFEQAEIFFAHRRHSDSQQYLKLSWDLQAVGQN